MEEDRRSLRLQDFSATLGVEWTGQDAREFDPRGYVRRAALETLGSLLMDAFAAVLAVRRAGPQNPSLPCTLAEARADLQRMARDPKPLARPILVLGAYHAWAPVQWALLRKLRRLTGAPPD